MATNPVEVISRTRTCLARGAALKALACFAAPVVTALLLAALMPQIAAAVARYSGYVLAVGARGSIRLGLVAAAVMIAASGIFRGWRAYRERNDFVRAAEELDDHLGAHQEIVTLATLANPEAPEAVRSGCSALFPVLWRRVMKALGGFDPENVFRPEIGEPLRRSSLYAAGVVVALGLAMLALAEPPTSLQKTALSLRHIANKIEATAASPEDRALAAAVRKAAEDLTNPKLPPERKMEELKAVMRKVEERPEPGKAKGGSSAGNGSSPSPNASGEAKGKGEGQGTAPGGTEKKPGANTTIELRNEIAKAEVQVQTEGSKNKPSAEPSPGGKTGSAPRPGENPNLKGGGSDKDKNGPAPVPVPSAGETGAQAKTSGNQPKGGGSYGDTHLGEFPAPADYQRFYKPGEKGAKIGIKDARYVMFRLPSAIVSSGGGEAVADTETLKATTPYTNAPLKPLADNAPPDERQFVPPRYRDLIR